MCEVLAGLLVPFLIAVGKPAIKISDSLMYLNLSENAKLKTPAEFASVAKGCVFAFGGRVALFCFDLKHRFQDWRRRRLRPMFG